MICGIGGLLVYEFGSDALLTTLAGGLIVGATDTVGTATAAGAGEAPITMAKGAG